MTVLLQTSPNSTPRAGWHYFQTTINHLLLKKCITKITPSSCWVKRSLKPLHIFIYNFTYTLLARNITTLEFLLLQHSTLSVHLTGLQDMCHKMISLHFFMTLISIKCYHTAHFDFKFWGACLWQHFYDNNSNK